MERADIVIVGGGIAGLATAWWLARSARGRVLVLERDPGFGRQASGQNAAILRTFGSDPVLCGIARSSAELLRHPGPGFGSASLLDPCGLFLGASGQYARGLEGALEQSGESTGARRVERGELARLVPHLALSPELALFFPREGRIDIGALLDGLAAGARSAGVELRTAAEVRELLRERTRVNGVRLADETEIRARIVVLAAGGWAARLGRSAGSRVELLPTRRHLLVTEADRRIDPRWPVLWIEDEGFYCRPEGGGLLACACDQDPVDPDRCQPEPRVREEIRRKTRKILHGFEGVGAARFWCGLRTLTSDGRFAVGFDPDVEGLFWVAGLGGHGMTAGIEVGRLAAALLSGEPIDAELERALDPRRLARERAPALES